MRKKVERNVSFALLFSRNEKTSLLLYKLDNPMSDTTHNLGLTEDDFHKLRRGDPRLQTRVFDKYAPHFMQIIKSKFNITIEADVEDIVSEAFAKLFCKVLAGDVQLDNLNGYIYTIIKNKCFAYTERKSKNIIENKEVLPDIIEDEPPPNEWLTALNTAFNRLGVQCQKLLSGFYWEDKDHKEMALELGISEDASRQRKRECMKKLRSLFNNHATI